MEEFRKRELLVSKGWIQAVAVVVLFGFFVLGLLAYRTYTGEAPIPARVVDPEGNVLFTRDDIIGGQPLKYRRTGDEQFVLYSIGWNEKDDGGTVALTDSKPPRVNLDKGDWVWEYPVN